MPFYEYQCKACGHHLEVMQKFSDAPLKKCPNCGKSQLVKLMSAPVFRLKGSGWYETDFKSDKEGKRNLAAEKDEAPAAAKDSDKGKVKEADKSENKSTDSAADKSPDKPADKKAEADKPAAKDKTRPAAARSAARKPTRGKPAPAKKKKARR